MGQQNRKQINNNRRETKKTEETKTKTCNINTNDKLNEV